MKEVLSDSTKVAMGHLPRSKSAFPNFGTLWDDTIERSDLNPRAAWQWPASQAPCGEVRKSCWLGAL
jgi:hypothetical protein